VDIRRMHGFNNKTQSVEVETNVYQFFYSV